MNLKKKIKGFFTLTRKADGGFTLVELIVVIAILAILAGVAVPAYSGYVTRANKQADISLVGDVAHALQLYYYSDPTNAASGYVVLQNGADATADEAGVGAAAMEKTFGTQWQGVASLKYGEWTDDGLLKHVLDNADSAGLIADSTFLTKASTESMMKTVTNLTNAATKVIQQYAAGGGDVETTLAAFTSSAFVESLQDAELDPNSDQYATVASNMLVGFFAESMNGLAVEDATADQGIVGMAAMYAQMYAYAEASGNTTIMAQIDANLANSNNLNDLTSTSLGNFVAANDPDFFAGYMGYYMSVGEDGVPVPNAKFNDDTAALLEIMGAVGHVSGTYDDIKTLSDPNLYASASVAQQLDNYITAINAVAGMDATTLAALQTLANQGIEGAIVLFLAGDGSVSAIPGAAYLAG